MSYIFDLATLLEIFCTLRPYSDWNLWLRLFTLRYSIKDLLWNFIFEQKSFWEILELVSKLMIVRDIYYESCLIQKIFKFFKISYTVLIHNAIFNSWWKISKISSIRISSYQSIYFGALSIRAFKFTIFRDQPLKIKWAVPTCQAYIT